MSVTAEAALPTSLTINRQLFEAITSAAENSLQMAGVSAVCVGVTRSPNKKTGEVTGMIGVHGAVSGFLSVNMSEELAIQVVSGLLHERCESLSPQVIDGSGEFANLVAGGVKASLAGGEWAFSQITIPSVIVGEGYHVAYGHGTELVEVAFEIDNPNVVRTSDRMLYVTLSLLRI